MPCFAVMAILLQSGQKPNALWQFLPLVLIAVVFYVLLILPARRRQKAHEAMIGELGSGDKVITNGGLIGTITKVEEKSLRVKLAPSVEVTVLRSHIAGKAGEETT